MHIFFDLDGTLTDPREGIVNCFRHALTSLGIDVPPDKRLETCIGPPMRDALRELCGDGAIVEHAVTLYRERFSSVGLFENRVYDGIPECLERLQGRADSIHVVTSKPTVYSERIVEHFELECYFGAVYGSHLDGRLSDKTELIAHVLERESIDPRDAVMVGDRRFDVQGAKNHGIRSVGALWGYGGRQELEAAGADALCAHPGEVRELLLGSRRPAES